MLDRITLQGKFDKHFSGGAIAHLNMDQEIADVETMKDLILHCAKQGVIYFAINYVLQECENKHMFVGNTDTCNICGGKVIAKYTRVVGFMTKVDGWIPERKEIDFPNRQFYKEVGQI
jgi:ribonucleoside-triphosphate reductase